MKVGDEVYLREDSEWNDGSENNPISTKGRIIDIDGHENLPISVDWGFGSNSYKSLDLILAPEYEKENMKDNTPYKTLSDYENSLAEKFMKDENPKCHPNASILMEIAKEAAVNLEYWKEFEWFGKATPRWMDFAGESDFLHSVSGCTHKIRRKPRTIHIGNYDVPKRENRNIWIDSNHKNIVNVACDDTGQAELMLKALQELLGAKK